MKNRLLAVTLLITVIISSCSTSSGLSPLENEQARIQTETPKTNSGTADTPAIIPSPSPVPPTVTPQVATPTELNPAGPYILFSNESGIWITNPDGSFPTQLTALDAGLTDMHRAISPDGTELALVAKDDLGIGLYLVDIPSGETKKIAQLLLLSQDDLLTATSPKALASYAIGGYENVAWQPRDGHLLAFTGAINGPTSDLYLYETQSGEMNQLTDGPSQAIAPSWSPDGEYILHYGVSWVPPFGGAIVGYNRIDGAWAVRVSDGAVLDQPKPKGYHGNFVGWQDDSHYMIFDSDETCYSVNLRNVNVVDGTTTPVMDFSFYYSITQSPVNMALVFSGDDDCESSPGEGVFLLPAGQSTPSKLEEKKAYEINWLPESGVYQAYPEALFSSDGSIRYDPPVYDKSFHPAISVKGYQAWEVIENQQGRVEVRALDGIWKKILDGSVSELIWDPSAGDTLVIALQDGSLYSAQAPEFTPRLLGNLGGRTSQAIWIP